ncbi:MAG: glycine/betaine/sarcosine/D-proline family reductase selenoprotein B [Pseudonocardiaceae bacterium]|nr:glycine/betaine/sarcosine/D-proline family reductase selenoprotein B [Pseudonocardiaceae bacterium]
MMRVVHYINQFYAGLGGEEAAGLSPRLLDGPAGPGRLLDQLLGDEHEVVATVVCGDNHAAGTAGVTEELLGMVREAGAELLLTGPAFGSGRYGMACARLAAAGTTAGLPSLAAMHPDNPGIGEAGTAPVIAAGASARKMRASLQRVAPALAKLAAGQALTEQDGRVGRSARLGRLVEHTAAQRAVELVLRRLAGEDADAVTEIPLGGFDSVEPAAPVEKVGAASVALLTEGALVPAGNPDRLESARATRWLRYSVDGLDTLADGDWESVDGGFATTAANADPNRLVPLDAARALQRDGAVGGLHDELLVTVGNGTSVVTARRFGVEWAARLRAAGVQAAILTAT